MSLGWGFLDFNNAKWMTTFKILYKFNIIIISIIWVTHHQEEKAIHITYVHPKQKNRKEQKLRNL